MSLSTLPEGNCLRPHRNHASLAPGLADLPDWALLRGVAPSVWDLRLEEFWWRSFWRRCWFTEAPVEAELITQLEFALNGGGPDLDAPRPASNIDSVVVRLEDGTEIGEFVRDGDSVSRR